jgi:hypothetical protein
LAFGLTVSGSGKSLLRACLPLRDLTKLSCPAQCAGTRGLLTAPLTAQRIMSPVRCGVQESGVPARTPWRLSPPMQYDRVFPVAIPGELHIPPFCALSGWRPRFPLPCIRRISRVGTIPSVTMRDRDSRHQAVRGAATAQVTATAGQPRLAALRWDKWPGNGLAICDVHRRAVTMPGRRWARRRARCGRLGRGRRAPRGQVCRSRLRGLARARLCRQVRVPR